MLFELIHTHYLNLTSVREPNLNRAVNNKKKNTLLNMV